MRTTILLAGFSNRETGPAVVRLLSEGACALAAPDLEAAIGHLRGGAVDAVAVHSDLDSEQLRREAGARGLQLVIDDALTPQLVEEVLRLGRSRRQNG